MDNNNDIGSPNDSISTCSTTQRSDYLHVEEEYTKGNDYEVLTQALQYLDNKDPDEYFYAKYMPIFIDKGLINDKFVNLKFQEVEKLMSPDYEEEVDDIWKSIRHVKRVIKQNQKRKRIRKAKKLDGERDLQMTITEPDLQEIINNRPKYETADKNKYSYFISDWKKNGETRQIKAFPRSYKLPEFDPFFETRFSNADAVNSHRLCNHITDAFWQQLKKYFPEHIPSQILRIALAKFVKKYPMMISDDKEGYLEYYERIITKFKNELHHRQLTIKKERSKLAKRSLNQNINHDKSKRRKQNFDQLRDENENIDKNTVTLDEDNQNREEVSSNIRAVPTTVITEVNANNTLPQTNVVIPENTVAIPQTNLALTRDNVAIHQTSSLNKNTAINKENRGCNDDDDYSIKTNSITNSMVDSILKENPIEITSKKSNVQKNQSNKTRVTNPKVQNKQSNNKSVTIPKAQFPHPQIQYIGTVYNNAQTSKYRQMPKEPINTRSKATDLPVSQVPLITTQEILLLHKEIRSDMDQFEKEFLETKESSQLSQEVEKNSNGDYMQAFKAKYKNYSPKDLINAVPCLKNRDQFTLFAKVRIQASYKGSFRFRGPYLDRLKDKGSNLFDVLFNNHQKINKEKYAQFKDKDARLKAVIVLFMLEDIFQTESIFVNLVINEKERKLKNFILIDTNKSVFEFVKEHELLVLGRVFFDGFQILSESINLVSCVYYLFVANFAFTKEYEELNKKVWVAIESYLFGVITTDEIELKEMKKKLNFE